MRSVRSSVGGVVGVAMSERRRMWSVGSSVGAGDDRLGRWSTRWLDTGVDREALQRRTLRSLRFAQVPGQAAVAGMVAVVSLLASDLLGSDRLAGMGSASFTIGAAFTAIPLAAFMRRRGRRIGLGRALLIGARRRLDRRGGWPAALVPALRARHAGVRCRAGGHAAAAIRRRRPGRARPAGRVDRGDRVGRHARRGARPAAHAVREGGRPSDSDSTSSSVRSSSRQRSSSWPRRSCGSGCDPTRSR